MRRTKARRGTGSNSMSQFYGEPNRREKRRRGRCRKEPEFCSAPYTCDERIDETIKEGVDKGRDLPWRKGSGLESLDNYSPGL